MKKIFSVLLVIILAFSLLSCDTDNETNIKNVNNENVFEDIDNDEDDYKFIPTERVKANKHVEKIDEFDSEISVGYKNEDGTYTAYIFSSPIRNRKGLSGFEDIDNRIIKVSSGNFFDKGYRYRNNKGYALSYFPSRLSESEMFLIESDLYDLKIGLLDEELEILGFGEKENIWEQKRDTVIYSNESFTINSYATKAGLRTEIKLDKLPKDNRIDFIVQTTDLRKNFNSSDYITFIDETRDDDNKIQAIIKAPIVKDSYNRKTDENNPHVFLENRLESESIEKFKHKISIILDENLKDNKNVEFPITIDMSWEMHTSKQPDSVIYSEDKFTNRYLVDYSLIGNSDMLGIGENYARLRLHEYIKDKPDNIKSAYYNVYEMSDFSSDANISLHKINSFWSSAQITWNRRIVPEYKITENIANKGGYYQLDITEVAKKALEDDTYEMESYGILMCGSKEKNSYRIIASFDNPLFPPFEEITFYELPDNFIAYKK